MIVSPLEALSSGAKAQGAETILYVALKGPLFHGDEHLRLVICNL